MNQHQGKCTLSMFMVMTHIPGLNILISSRICNSNGQKEKWDVLIYLQVTSNKSAKSPDSHCFHNSENEITFFLLK